MLHPAGWSIERLGGMTSPLRVVEDGVIEHPWRVVAGLAALAGCLWLIQRAHSQPAVPARA